MTGIVRSNNKGGVGIVRLNNRGGVWCNVTVQERLAGCTIVGQCPQVAGSLLMEYEVVHEIRVRE